MKSKGYNCFRVIFAHVLLVILSLMCLFFFYILLVNATRSHADLQRGFSALPGGHLLAQGGDIAGGCSGAHLLGHAAHQLHAKTALLIGEPGDGQAVVFVGGLFCFCTAAVAFCRLKHLRRSGGGNDWIARRSQHGISHPFHSHR